MKPLLIVVLLLLGLAGFVIFKFVDKENNLSVSRSVNSVNTPSSSPDEDVQLSEKLKKLCNTSGGKVSVAVIHVETGKQAVVDASNELPLFSVYKVPLAITVLKNIEEGRLKLDRSEEQ